MRPSRQGSSVPFVLPTAPKVTLVLQPNGYTITWSATSEVGVVNWHCFLSPTPDGPYTDDPFRVRVDVHTYDLGGVTGYVWIQGEDDVATPVGPPSNRLYVNII